MPFSTRAINRRVEERDLENNIYYECLVKENLDEFGNSLLIHQIIPYKL